MLSILRNGGKPLLFCLCCLLCCLIWVQRTAAEKPVYTSVDAAKATSDFAIQGEYEGDIESQGITVGLQIIAQGNGKFAAVSYAGGLPGSSDAVEIIERTEGQLDDDTVTFQGADASGVYRQGRVEIRYQGETIATLRKVNRKSPTLGKKPPEDASVLFSSAADVDHWKKGRVDGDLLMQGTTSKETFSDHQLHIEFRLPFQTGTSWPTAWQ